MSRVFAVALVLCSLSGCGSPTAPPSGVEVQVAVSDSAVVAGEAVSVSVAIHNHSARTFFVPGSRFCFAWLEVQRMPDLELISRGDRRVCDAAIARHPVAPGSHIVDEFLLSTMVDAGDLEPGVYRIRGGARIEGHGIVWSSPRQLEVAAD